jgi:putative oxidoreductase
MLNRPLPVPARDIAMLIARIILGVVLFAHGWQKLVINGISDTYGQFEKLGIPLAIVSASFTSFVEFVGGVLIILGALTTTVVALDLVVMVGAAGFVHVTHGIFAKDGGWELVGVIVAVELALAAFGPGRYSVDDLVSRRRARERADLERRRSAPVAQAPVVSAAFTPAVDPRAAMATGGFGAITPSSGVATSAFAVADAPTGAFAVATPVVGAFAAADAPTGAFTAVARTADGSTGASAADPAGGGSTGAFAAATSADGSLTGASAAAPAARSSQSSAAAATGASHSGSATAPAAQSASTAGVPASTGAFAAVLRASAGVPMAASTVVPRASTGVAGSAFAAAAKSSNGVPTGGFAAVSPAPAAVAEPAVDTPTTDAFPAVPAAAPAEEAAPEADDAPAPSNARRAESSPRMASAGVHRTLSERAGRADLDTLAPFGVTVQSPLDFTPTTALPVVPPMSVETDTITVATSVPGGLPRRVRAADLPPASAVRPYA